MSYISKTKGGITDTKISWSVTHLFWLSLGPIVQSVLTYENPILGFVDQCVKWHKGHNAGQRETAGFNLHSNLKSNTTQEKIKLSELGREKNCSNSNVLPGNLCIDLYT